MRELIQLKANHAFERPRSARGAASDRGINGCGSRSMDR